MFSTKILLATDGSEEAARAARMATTLSENLGSEVHLVRVEAIPSALADPESVYYGAGYWQQVHEIARRDVTEKLGEEVQIDNGDGRRGSGVIRKGRPARRRDSAHGRGDRGGARSNGQSGFRHAETGLTGSVVRHAHGSVLVVLSEERRRAADTQLTEELGRA